MEEIIPIKKRKNNIHRIKYDFLSGMFIIKKTPKKLKLKINE
jgi:hypothetical protein